jgi:hypothetical protein
MSKSPREQFDDAVESVRNAPRLDILRPLSNSGIKDQEGGTPRGPGRPENSGGAPGLGVPGGGGTAEHIGGFNDRQIKPADLPDTPTTPRTRTPR